mmetsp:Transcript_3355/g.2805  ORF Transcript_3355/g.2805 Transcript_3355/m.2805 type:complete len:108 (-) Transcript_3355:190-513(-)
MDKTRNNYCNIPDFVSLTEKKQHMKRKLRHKDIFIESKLKFMEILEEILQEIDQIQQNDKEIREIASLDQDPDIKILKEELFRETAKTMCIRKESKHTKQEIAEIKR